jgi:mono/diheme cytochrome c family protein
MVSLLGVCCVAQSEHADAKNRSASSEGSAALARGKYIVEDLAVCSQCHTPRDAQGIPDRKQWLDGAALWLQPAQPSSDWPLLAPRIAGDPPGNDAEMVKLLTTGVWRDGKPLRPPMPQFRMSTEDAVAVIAYLKSLGSQSR